MTMAQQWYSQAIISNYKRKKQNINVKEKELQELKVQLDMQIAKNNQDKEKLIEHYQRI